jgi:uncharacterized protein (TIGR00369 family)
MVGRSARSSLEEIPSRCFLCAGEGPRATGRSFVTRGPAEVETLASLHPHHEGHPGMAHGGVIAALLDEAIGRALTAGSPGRFMVTARLEVQYLRPIPIGSQVAVRARILEDHGFLALAECEARIGDTIVAQGRGTLARPSPLRQSAGR